MSLEGIKYSGAPNRSLQIINQLALPTKTEWLPIITTKQAIEAIKSMQVRGAPAIAIVAVLSLAVQLTSEDTAGSSSSTDSPKKFISDSLAELVQSRPTAVNLADAERKWHHHVQTLTGERIVDDYVRWAEEVWTLDIQTNQTIGKLGAAWLFENAWKTPGKSSILTHCNTGSLATAGYGTALGIIRSVYGAGRLQRVFAGETRPYNQGARLTTYELVHDKIPVTLLTDSMAAAALARKDSDNKISAVIVGADRVVRNGDTANKIGTYGLAVLAKFHGVPFVVAAPTTTVDLNTETGEKIVIEQRAASELTSIEGKVIGADKVERIQIAAEGCDVWNPAFDVTPAHLISAIVTEKGVFEKGEDGRFDLSSAWI